MTHVIVHDMDSDSVWVAADGYASDTNYSGANDPPFALSGNGQTVLYERFDQEPHSTHAQLIRNQGGFEHTIAEASDANNGTATGSWSYASGWSQGADMSADGNTVVFESFYPEQDYAGLNVYKASTNSSSIALTTNLAWQPHISPDGTTVTYNGDLDPEDYTSPDASWVKKLATGPDDNGSVFLDHCTSVTGMSENGSYITYAGCYGIDGQAPVGIYDAASGSTTATARTPTSISNDGSRALSVIRDLVTGGGGVWLQNYNLPPKDLSQCNQPDYGYIGQYERRTGIRVKLCNDAEHPLNFGRTDADRGIKPPGWPTTVPANLNVPASWPKQQVFANGPVFARGHLYAAVLGGSNTDDRNFITQFTWSNSVLQNGIELTLRDALKAQNVGQVYYYVTPVYSDSPSLLPDPTPAKVGPQGWVGALPNLEYAMPNKIHIVTISTTGFSIDACVPNTNDGGGTVVYGDPCLA